jgi:ATP-dependent protease ClpP protease subunit
MKPKIAKEYNITLSRAVLAEFSVHDDVQFTVSEMHSICIRLAASIGSFILAEGVTRR